MNEDQRFLLGVLQIPRVFLIVNKSGNQVVWKIPHCQVFFWTPWIADSWVGGLNKANVCGTADDLLGPYYYTVFLCLFKGNIYFLPR